MSSNNKKGLSNWLSAHSNSKTDDRALETIWEVSGSFDGGFEPNLEAGLSRFQNRMANDGGGKIVRLKRRSRILQLAAAVALLLVAGYAYLNFDGNYSSTNTLNAFTVEHEVKDMVFSDGSKASLNALSAITYPDVFSGEKREVELKGEAFFDVEKNEEQAFQITTTSGLVEVLGTSFNVRDVEGENTMEVYVKTGKVAVTIPMENKRYILGPGQTLIHDKAKGSSSIHEEENENPIAWKTKVLRFRNAPLREIFHHMERVYGVEIQAENENLKSCPFTTTVRAEKLRDAFKALEVSCDLTFNVVAPGKFEVSGNCCE